jgi:hypothetical protein
MNGQKVYHPPHNWNIPREYSKYFYIQNGKLCIINISDIEKPPKTKPISISEEWYKLLKMWYKRRIRLYNRAKRFVGIY